MSEEQIEINCAYCNKIHPKSLRRHKNEVKNFPDKKFYCSIKCAGLDKTVRTKINVQCDNCGVFFDKFDKEIKKSNYNFCGNSCKATFLNKIRAEKGMTTKNKKKMCLCVDCSKEIEVSIHENKLTTRCDECRQSFLSRDK